jgi:hypothetical protein
VDWQATGGTIGQDSCTGGTLGAKPPRTFLVQVERHDTYLVAKP